MLTVVLLDVRRFEILRVLDVVKSLAQGLEAVEVVRKLRSASCVDDVPCVYNGIGYLFSVVHTVVVVAVWLRARSLICLWLATSGAMTTRSFLNLLVFFGSAYPAVVDARGLRGYGLLEVLLLQ